MRRVRRREFDPVKPHLWRVSVLGPESTGKTTLAKNLAERYLTTWCPEYLREFCETLGRMPVPTDQREIVRGQLAGEEEAAAGARRVLFCDTDPMMTGVYALFYFDECPDWLLDVSRERRYDLTLLLSPKGIPWVSDPLRDAPHARDDLFDRCRAFLARTRRRYIVIDGPFETRLEQAAAAVDSLLSGR